MVIRTALDTPYTNKHFIIIIIIIQVELHYVIMDALDQKKPVNDHHIAAIETYIEL
jgi:hypothetical protein